jgi:hypothetical protein
MQGDIVIARGFRNKPYVRRVVSVAGGKVYISNEQEYNRLLSGEEAIPPVGVPREDVFCFDSTVLDELTRNYDKPSAWGRLKVWSEKGE